MAFVVIATWIAREGEEQGVLAALTKLAGPSRQEPGCLFYQPQQDVDDPRRIVIYEQYADRAAYEAHAASEHFKEFGLGEGIPLLESRERQFLETFG